MLIPISDASSRRSTPPSFKVGLSVFCWLQYRQFNDRLFICTTRDGKETRTQVFRSPVETSLFDGWKWAEQHFRTIQEFIDVRDYRKDRSLSRSTLSMIRGINCWLGSGQEQGGIMRNAR